MVITCCVYECYIVQHTTYHVGCSSSANQQKATQRVIL